MSSIKESSLGLNYGWTYGETGWNSGMDENIVLTGFHANKQIKGILSTPPTTGVNNGDAYIVGSSPTGTWVGNYAKVAIYDRGSWLFAIPSTGVSVYNRANGCWYEYNNGWSLRPEAEESPYIKVKDFDFSTGYTITDSRQLLFYPTNQTYYQWNGSLPKVVAAGSTPATSGGIGAGAWVDRTDVKLRSDINIVVKRFASVADMVADNELNVGQIVETIGYRGGWNSTGNAPKGGNLYEIVHTATGVSDGGSFITLANGFQAKGLFIDDVYSPDRWGANCDGVAADDTYFAALCSYADAKSLTVDVDGLSLLFSTTTEMPKKIKGNCSVSGHIKWTQKNGATQDGKLTVSGNVLLSGIYYCQFDNIDNSGFTLTIDGYSSSWGSFWNEFKKIKTGTLIIDVDKGQSVNQNIFMSVRGGVHVVGINTSGIRECHNNIIVNLDTTGANITASDGTTGCHILNDSNLNQPNTIMNWYAESSGTRLAYGNWDILGSHVDSNNPPLKIGRRNSSLFAGGTSRNGSFIASSSVNAARGGDWGELYGSGYPRSVSFSGGGQSLVSVQNSPDGNLKAVQQIGGAAYRFVAINYELSQNDKVEAVAYLYQEGSPTRTYEIYQGTSLIAAGSMTLTDLGGGWYLARITGNSSIRDDASGKTTGQIRIYTTTSSALTAADLRKLGSYFVTTEAICPLPAKKLGQIVGYDTAAPTGGTWGLGDICWNTSPTASEYVGWVCVAAGTPGAWKGFGTIAA